MMFSTLSILLLAVTDVKAQAIPPVKESIDISAKPFGNDQVTLDQGRFQENQGRTLTYLKSVDVDRLLYNFRDNHGLSTNGAAATEGWEAPDFPFRTHSQGHFLTAWAQCYAALGDTECRDRAVTLTNELAKCQANNEAAGFNPGYLSGYPESEYDALEERTLDNGNVPYYTIHKTMAGLLDVYHLIGDEVALETLTGLGDWVDFRTSRLSYTQMQEMLQTEFGGMNDIFAAMYAQTGEDKWLTVAQRFDHDRLFDPLAANEDRLDGLHANTQVPKWIGTIREYQATGDTRYFNIALNAWNMTVNTHTYAIGGNSQAEHFRATNAIAGFLRNDACEACNTYNMLKLTKELWATDPENAAYFDFFEQALMNHLIGAQDPNSNHGHITYFTPLQPGGRRGVGPAWGGGTYSTDYGTFWCCQGTQIEQNTKLMDSIYGHNADNLYVNLFAPSQLNWAEKSVTIKQDTRFPSSDTSSLTVTGESSQWTLQVRIPEWTTDAEISVNGEAQNLNVAPGSYAQISRQWSSGDEITIKLPMKLRTIPANDDPSVQAIAYGPSTLSGNYGDTALDSMPTLDLASLEKGEGLTFTGVADGQQVELVPFMDAHGFNYNVYWKTSGSLA